MSEESTIVGSLDMDDGRDREKIATLAEGRISGRRIRWNVDAELRESIIRALKVAMRRALEKQDQRAINGCASTLMKLERMNQIDELTREKYDRIDAGKFTANVGHRHAHAHVHMDVTDPEVQDALFALHRATMPKAQIEPANGTNGQH